MIKSNGIFFSTLFLLIITMSGCELFGDVLEFGIWVGVIIVVAVVALIWWIIRKFKR